MHIRIIVFLISGYFTDFEMRMVKNMSNTKLWDLITFLYLFPDAELVCDGDMGIVLLECCVDSPAAMPVF